MASLEYRGVAQMVERLIWDQEVGGSRPSTPTTKDTYSNF